MTAAEHPDITIPAPDWATFCDAWDWTGPATAWRYAEHHLTECGRPWCVYLSARQDYDNGVVTNGRVRVQLDLAHGDVDLSACDARDLAGQLVEAATLCDWANEVQPAATTRRTGPPGGRHQMTPPRFHPPAGLKHPIG